MLIPRAVRKTMESLEAEPNTPEAGETPTVGLILREHLPWIMGNGAFSEEQRKAARAMAACRTPAMGTYVDYCPNCRKVVSVRYCSCNNRNCPGCQYPLQRKWLELRKSETVEGTPQFHIVLTLPHELNELVYSNAKALLKVLFESASHAVLELCADPRYLGAKPGIISVLHTWKQDLGLHYHIHMVCTAGGITPGGEYVSVRKLYPDSNGSDLPGNNTSYNGEAGFAPDNPDDELSPFEASECTTDNTEADSRGFFLPLKALTSLFRGKYMAAIRDLYDNGKLFFPEHLDYLNDPHEWSGFCSQLYGIKWIGYIAKTFEGSGNAMDYLARYIFRTAISNSRIVDYDGNHVNILVRNNDKPGNRLPISLEVHDFIFRLLRHILPKGFTRVRFYGFLANGQKKKNLNRIFQQLKGKKTVPSPLKNMNSFDLITHLFPEKRYGCCPICNKALRTFQFDHFSIPLKVVSAAPRAAPVTSQSSSSTAIFY